MFMTPTQALSQDAREYAREIKDTWQEALGSILEVCRVLVEAKGTLEAADYNTLINAYLPFSPNRIKSVLIRSFCPTLCPTPATKEPRRRRGSLSGNGLLRRGFLTPALLDLLLNPLFNIGRNPRCHYWEIGVGRFDKFPLADKP